MKTLFNIGLFFTIFLQVLNAQTNAEAQQSVKGSVMARSRQNLLTQLPTSVAYLTPEFEEVQVIYRDGSTFHGRMNVCLVDLSVRMINDRGDTLFVAHSDDVARVLSDNSVYVQIKGRFYKQLMVYGNLSIAQEKRFEFKEPEISAGYGSAPKTSTAVQMSTREYNHSRAYDYETEIPYSLDYKYVLIKDQKIYPAKTSNFTKLFPDKKKAIKQFIADHNLDLGRKEDLLSLFYFCTQAE
ncbi:MAG: hypothetical protein IKV28_04855 [Bacteroidales bacterium]|nr:hypothetical protein [Bacteroidales bacterium]